MRPLLSIVTVLFLILPAMAGAESSEFFKEFKAKYDLLSIDLFGQEVEVAEISNFVYEKDIATFTFTEGKIFLARPIEGRATTALFIGKGHASITIPSHVERQSLWFVSGDSAVDESFELCLVRMSDDFDLALREKLNFTPTKLDWKNFNKMAKAQGENFFTPQVLHKYDNYFQLMRSLYQRAADGYFWIDFNRYVYTFDPARPEQVIVAYEYEGGDEAVTDGAMLQRKEHGVVDDLNMSDIIYPVTILSQKADLHLGGLDGKRLNAAGVKMTVRVNRDSLRFFSLFLHTNMNIDSIKYNSKPVDYLRRGSFLHLGIMLPEYRYKGDSINLELWYHGKQYTAFLPFTADPAASNLDLDFDIRSGFNYLAPSMNVIPAKSEKRDAFNSAPAHPYRTFQFESLPSGYDTIALSGANGLPINILKSSYIRKKNFNNFIPDKHYRKTILAAIDYMTLRLGPPVAEELYVYPDTGVTGANISMPGLLEISQVQMLVDGTGGLEIEAGREAARQWFGALAQPATDREYWILDALPDYLGLLFVRQHLDPGVFFGELGLRRDVIYTQVERGRDRPLATGERVSGTQRTAKGTWLLHMLRILMYDLERNSDRPFWKFVRDLNGMINDQKFTNADIISLAEKHYGQSLDWFFKQWLFSRNIPEFKVEYRITETGGQYLIKGKISTKGVSPDFNPPVIMRVELENNKSSIIRQNLSSNGSFELGPFTDKPKQLIFNELYSVLSKQKVKKK